jgi:CRP-like cAMP-binding protein
MGQMTDCRVDVRDAVRRLRLFSDVLSPAQLDDLAAQCRPCAFRAKSTLISQGDFGSSMFGILDGVVSAVFIDPHERENGVATLSAGQSSSERVISTASGS